MAWEQRTNTSGRYYYRSRRLPNGCVVKEYCGTGQRGARAAEADRLRQAEQSVERQRRHDLLEHVQRVAAPLVILCKQNNVIIEAALLAAGYHRRKGEWRKKRHGRHSDPD
jgi:hypothetical protein